MEGDMAAADFWKIPVPSATDVTQDPVFPHIEIFSFMRHDYIIPLKDYAREECSLEKQKDAGAFHRTRFTHEYHREQRLHEVSAGIREQYTRS
jgi:hypothetical protein